MDREAAGAKRYEGRPAAAIGSIIRPLRKRNIPMAYRSRASAYFICKYFYVYIIVNIVVDVAK